MRPSDPVKLVAELLDLPIRDKDGRYCGIVDDVELTGCAGKEMKVAALLVGPGAYEGRMPGWLFQLVTKVAGNRITRVPIGKVEQIHTFVRLSCPAEQVKLNAAEDNARAWIPRAGAM